jgi:hypothetical protein
MTAEVNEKLGQFLNQGQNWEKKSTSLPGVFILIFYSIHYREINPIGLGTKKRGIIIRSGSELEQIDQLLSNPKVAELAKKIETANPKIK